mmetsp:Transcript_79088/g.221846  ORF Transcript_79088/g.221846 Transcript_79088/m.221846 type:complete len:227 (+) Transcript_79088:133-813(+)
MSQCTRTARVGSSSKTPPLEWAASPSAALPWEREQPRDGAEGARPTASWSACRCSPSSDAMSSSSSGRSQSAMRKACHAVRALKASPAATAPCPPPPPPPPPPLSSSSLAAGEPGALQRAASARAVFGFATQTTWLTARPEREPSSMAARELPASPSNRTVPPSSLCQTAEVPSAFACNPSPKRTILGSCAAAAAAPANPDVATKCRAASIGEAAGARRGPQRAGR